MKKYEKPEAEILMISLDEVRMGMGTISDDDGNNDGQYGSGEVDIVGESVRHFPCLRKGEERV